jgi:hypothetical protein
MVASKGAIRFRSRGATSDDVKSMDRLYLRIPCGFSVGRQRYASIALNRFVVTVTALRELDRCAQVRCTPLHSTPCPTLLRIDHSNKKADYPRRQ